MSRMIDADDLLTAFPIGDEPTVTIACIRATIKHMPTIEERKTGKWVDYNTTCSECGWQMIDDVIESPNIVAFNFCPNCGADMRGGNQ